MYVIMKTMCLPDYHHNGFVATHAYYICQLMSAHATTYIYICINNKVLDTNKKHVKVDNQKVKNYAIN